MFSYLISMVKGKGVAISVDAEVVYCLLPYFSLKYCMLSFPFRKHVGRAGEDLPESWQQKTLV